MKDKYKKKISFSLTYSFGLFNQSSHMPVRVKIDVIEKGPKFSVRR